MKSEENFPFWVRVPSTSEAIRRMSDKSILFRDNRGIEDENKSRIKAMWVKYIVMYLTENLAIIRE
jgi:hypothetical protein